MQSCSSSTGGQPERQNGQPFLSAARRWARQRMEKITRELEHATGSKRDALRQTRRIYSSFVRGDDILQDSEDEEEEHARQEAEAAAAEEDEAETAAAAAARAAEEEAARAARWSSIALVCACFVPIP